MKQILTLGLALMLAFASYAQDEVTKFLGIPIDGTKNEMIAKLKAKGYIWNTRRECLEGEFNGRDVYLHVVTNNNKVYRICVEDKIGSSEGDIKIRFNKLCRQFERNNRYTSKSNNSFELSETEDISYEMTVNEKRYEASYYQLTDMDKDSVMMREYVRDKVMAQISNENISDTSVLIQSLINLQLVAEQLRYMTRSVWFMIHREYGQYYILLFYDNQLNQANGEDL